MRNRRYKLTLRKISTAASVGKDLEIEIKRVEDIKSMVNTLGEQSKLLLCLGPYEMGTVDAYSDDCIHLRTLFNIISYSNTEGAGYILKDSVLIPILNKKISLKDFIEWVFSEYYQVEVVKNSRQAWRLLQNGWKCSVRMKRFINPLLVSEFALRQEKRLIFLKGRKR